MSDPTVAAQIEELRRLPFHRLVARYTELWGHEPPIKSRSYVFRRTAWKLQELRYSGLSQPARDRLEELIAETKTRLQGRVRTERRPLPRRGAGPKVGTVLTRQYKGEEIRVHVRPEGYEYGGVVYKSLSAVARAITGSRWNGPLFFGMSPRRESK